MTPLPGAVQPFVAFPTLLRANGFAVSPDQTIGFIEAIGLLGPTGIDDIRRAGVALLSIPQDRRDAYDALFDSFFLGLPLPDAVPGDDDEVAAHEATGATEDVPQDPEDEEPGEDATATERLSRRDLAGGTDAALARLRRLGPALLPRRRGYRFAADRRGTQPDLRRTVRDAVRRDGDVLILPRRKRQLRQRRIMVLIDVSGSMAERTEDSLRIAHGLAAIAERVEVFTLGTRLTRVTPALRHGDPGRALAAASALIADIDGGTRIGEALRTFLAVPRYAGFARGAAVIVMSDGLERGTPDAMIAAIRRLARIAWRIDWLSPLAPDGAPQTGAMQAILPEIDSLGDGNTPAGIVEHLLSLGALR